MTNSTISARKNASISRGVGMTTQIYADRAENSEIWDVEGNRYMQKFLQLSPWRPGDLKVIAGKVDYPSWRWHERFMIRLIMKYTHGPTDPTAVIDYTDWDDVAAYGRHLLSLAA